MIPDLEQIYKSRVTTNTSPARKYERNIQYLNKALQFTLSEAILFCERVVHNTIINMVVPTPENEGVFNPFKSQLIVTFFSRSPRVSMPFDKG